MLQSLGRDQPPRTRPYPSGTPTDVPKFLRQNLKNNNNNTPFLNFLLAPFTPIYFQTGRGGPQLSITRKPSLVMNNKILKKKK